MERGFLLRAPSQPRNRRLYEVNIDFKQQKILKYVERINTAMTMIEAAEHGNYTKDHSKRVAKISKKIAEMAAWPEDFIRFTCRVALLHDIGKIAIAKDIILKKSALTKKERKLVERHPSVGARILRKLSMPFCAHVVEQHHELLDGSGYPKGIKRKCILLPSRIITVADVFDAMVSERPYRSALSFKTALDHLTDNPQKYDSRFVSYLVELASSGFLSEMYLFKDTTKLPERCDITKI